MIINKKDIALSALIAGILFLICILFTIFKKDEYTSRIIAATIDIGSEIPSTNDFLSNTPFGALSSNFNISPDKQRIIVSIYSRKFLERLLSKDEDILIFFFTENSDKEGFPVVKKNILNGEIWNYKNRVGETAKPTFEELHEYYLRKFKFIDDKQSGVFRLSMTHRSPYFAKSFLEKIISEFNDYMREEQKEYQKNVIQSFKDFDDEITNSTSKIFLSNIVEKAISQISVTDYLKDYSLRIIDGPYFPEKDNFSKAAFLALSLIISISLSFISVFSYRFVSRNLSFSEV